eukprot:5828325-Amphidinium_carterae.1
MSQYLSQCLATGLQFNCTRNASGRSHRLDVVRRIHFFRVVHTCHWVCPPMTSFTTFSAQG